MEYKPSYLNNLYADIQPSYTDSLAHHGIKGMHWGVRRYQNSDGSYTAAGKARRGSKNSISKNLTSSKVAKIAAGAAITAAGVAAIAYMNNSNISTPLDRKAEKAVDNYCKTAKKAAQDLWEEVDHRYHACSQAVSGDWDSIDAQMCRANAKQARKDANSMFEAHAKNRASFVNKAWFNKDNETTRRSKARNNIRETDKVISTTKDSLLDYADEFDRLAEILDKRRN